MMNLTEAQIRTIKCAHADLEGVLQCLVDGKGTPDGIDTDAIEQTVLDLERLFNSIIISTR